MNMRGAGDALRLCARLYNAGLDGDVVAALRAVSEQAPRSALLGFSLGANQTLLALARRAEALPPGFLGAVAVNPPIDLSACADALERLGNRLYQWYFLSSLRGAYRERQRLRPDLFTPGADVGPRTIREWDDAITAPHGGFASAAEYYARSSAGPLLREIRHPTLIISAKDDPMIPIGSVLPFVAGLDGGVCVEITPTGGHVGFVHRLDGATGFWAGDRALDFLGTGALKRVAAVAERRVRMKAGRPGAARPRAPPTRSRPELVALGRRVDAVGLIQLGYAGHALEQERDEGQVVLVRDLGVDRPEACGVVLPVVRERPHSQEDHAGRRRLLAQAVHDRLNVAAGGVGLLATQPVVRTRLQHDDGGVLSQQPLHAPQCGGRGLPADPGVHDPELQLRRVDALLEQSGVCLGRIDAETCRQARAQKQHRRTRILAGRCGRSRRERDRERPRDAPDPWRRHRMMLTCVRR